MSSILHISHAYDKFYLALFRRFFMLWTRFTQCALTVRLFGQLVTDNKWKRMQIRQMWAANIEWRKHQFQGEIWTDSVIKTFTWRELTKESCSSIRQNTFCYQIHTDYTANSNMLPWKLFYCAASSLLWSFFWPKRNKQVHENKSN